MYQSQTLSEIEKFVTGIEVQEAVNLVVAYIRRKHSYKTEQAAHIYWAALTDEEKLDVLQKSLRK